MSEKKDIREYLKYYIGCEVIGKYLDEDRKGYLTGVRNGSYECEIQFFEEDGFNVMEEPEFNEPSDVKLCLSRLEDMCEEDVKVCGNMGYDFSDDPNPDMHPRKEDFVNPTMLLPEQFHYLLSKGYDLFGLIESGLAIDKNQTTVK